MKLVEFFSHPMNISSNKDDRDTKTNVKKDELFWFILDHDKLHKDHFFPIAHKLKEKQNCTPEEVVEMFMPMVKQGCKEYYAHNKMTNHIGKLFPKDLREELCHQLYDHYKEGIEKDEYQLGN